MTDMFTFGSEEAIEALVRAVEQAGHSFHSFTGCEGCRESMANALETAFFCGYAWGEDYTGIPIHESSQWQEHLGAMELSTNQLVGLIYALRQAMELGDEWAGHWLSGLAEQYEMEWV
jgi:hypothetical protein